MLKREAPDHQHKSLYQLRKVTRVFALLVIVLLVVGYFIPRNYHIERNVVIDVSINEMTVFMSDASNLSTWLYVLKGRVERLDNSLKNGLELVIEYDSGDKGNIRIGSLTKENYQFEVIPKIGQRSVSNVIQLVSMNSGLQTKVTWSIEGELEASLLAPYLAIFANDIAGANFEKSLTLLKEKLEN